MPLTCRSSSTTPSLASLFNWSNPLYHGIRSEPAAWWTVPEPKPIVTGPSDPAFRFHRDGIARRSGLVMLSRTLSILGGSFFQPARARNRDFQVFNLLVLWKTILGT